MDIRRIDVLGVTYDNKIEEFHEGDILKVTARNNFGDREIKGRLDKVQMREITLDCSKEYETDIETINFRDISKIERV